MMKRTILMGLALGAVSAANAAINLTSLTYSENFDGTKLAAGSNVWSGTSNAAIPGTSGWEAARVGGTGTSMSMYVNNGSTSNGGMHSYGVSESSERALGGFATTSQMPGWGVEFVNATGSVITQIQISFYQENWRNPGSSGAVNTTTFGYRTSSSAVSNFVTASGFTGESALNLVGPTPSGGNVGIDGNAAANRFHRTATIVFGAPVAVGDRIYLRWQDFDNTGPDAGMAIDDFQLVATPANVVPEPFTMALGIAGAGVFVRRRLRKA